MIRTYRGRRKDSDKWVKGYYICLNQFDGNHLHIIVDEKNGEYHPVDIDTVGEYTGLTDRNGQEICEGDIIEIAPNGKEETHVVKTDISSLVSLQLWAQSSRISGNIHIEKKENEQISFFNDNVSSFSCFDT